MLRYSEFNPIPYEVHDLVYKRVSKDSKVLDIGCASGYFSKELKRKNCKSWGVELDAEATALAKNICEEVVRADLEKIEALPFEKKFFDTVLLLDVIEHLREPGHILQIIKPYLKADAKIIISTPNIAHILIRLKLFFGKFRYEEKGIMDKTHVHFFTKQTLVEFIQQNGIEILEIDTPADFGLLPFVGSWLRKIPKSLQYKITRLSPTLLCGQFILVCRIKG